MIFKFLKEYRIWLGLYLVLVFIFLVTFYLHDLPLLAFRQSLLFAGTIFLLVSLGAFYGFYKQWRSLENVYPGQRVSSSSKPFLQLTQQVLDDQYKLLEEEKEMVQQEEAKVKALVKMWSHQIKVPLASLDLMVQTDKLDSQQLASQLQIASNYLSLLLNYLKFKDKTDDFRFESLELRTVVSSIIRDYRIQFLAKNLSIQIDGNWNLVSDKKWLTFALSQIIDNAIKYSRPGGSIRILMDQDCLEITDQGLGILAEDLPRLFDEGFTGFNGHRYHKSTGLGLYMTKMVLDDLELAIEVESQVEVGTSVKIRPERKVHEKGTF